MTDQLKISHPGKVEYLGGGIETSMKQQRKALGRQDIKYTQKLPRDVDILHINVLSPRSVYYFWRAKRHGIPVIIHAHEIGENFEESFRFSTKLSPLVRIYLDFFYRRANLLISPSQYAKDVLNNRGIETPIKVISNGIDSERFEGIENRPSTDKFRAVNLSLVFERKGLTDFIETAEITSEIDFTWYGKKYSKLISPSSIHRKIASSPDNVEFPGFIDDVRDAFAEADVFFFPTKSETQGLSVIEAAYCGVPPVIRDIPVYEDIFEHEENCLKAETPEGFAEQIKRLEQDNDLREKISENAEKLGKQHTLDKIGEKLESAYNSLN